MTLDIPYLNALMLDEIMNHYSKEQVLDLLCIDIKQDPETLLIQLILEMVEKYHTDN
jgi:hypothetical protein